VFTEVLEDYAASLIRIEMSKSRNWLSYADIGSSDPREQTKKGARSRSTRKMTIFPTGLDQDPFLPPLTCNQHT
jgi:hypothetical protein